MCCVGSTTCNKQPVGEVITPIRQGALKTSFALGRFCVKSAVAEITRLVHVSMQNYVQLSAERFGYD